MSASSPYVQDTAGVMARMAKALAEAGLSQSEVARRALEICPKASRPIFHNAVKHGARPRSADVRAAYARVLGVDSSWLWYGARRQPSMLRDELLYEEVDIPSEIGDSRSAPTVLAVRPDPAGYLLPVSTSAWEPFAGPGDCLYLSPSYPAAAGDRVYLKSDRGEGVYRLLSTDAESVTVLSPSGLQIVLPRDGVILHRISGIVFA